MSIWRWPALSSHIDSGSQITLGEGNTPLIRSRKIGPDHGLANLYFKLESTNPTGSFKDRFAASAVSHMVARKQTRCIATSSGNTGSALAAYCAAASIRCHIAIVETAPLPKLRQMMAYGANIFRVRNFGLEPQLTNLTFERLNEFGKQQGSALQISSYTHSSLGMQGVESISYELNEQLDGAIDHIFCPAGGGGLCVAVARGFENLSYELATCQPAVHCVQPEGNDTICSAMQEDAQPARDVQCTTKISGLQVASVVDGDLVIQHCKPTGGTGHLVSDVDIWETQRRLAKEEGIFCEPAGAVALTGAMAAVAKGLISADSRIVCMATGTGFKDEDSITRLLNGTACPLIEVDDLNAVIDR